MTDFLAGNPPCVTPAKGNNEVLMSIQHQIRAFAGTFILVSLLLAHYHSTYWLWFTAFVGANLVQSAFTDLCPLEMFLRKIEKKPKSLDFGRT